MSTEGGDAGPKIGGRVGLASVGGIAGAARISGVDGAGAATSFAVPGDRAADVALSAGGVTGRVTTLVCEGASLVSAGVAVERAGDPLLVFAAFRAARRAGGGGGGAISNTALR